MSIWDETNERSAIRLLAGWILLERSEQVLSKGPRTPGDPAQAEGGQSAGWPPAPALCPQHASRRQHDTIRELSRLLKWESERKATAKDTRRIAEVLEYLNRDEEALFWWKKAATRGDEDAQDYLEILNAESAGNSQMRSDLREEEDRQLRFLSLFVLDCMSARRDALAAMRIALRAAPKEASGLVEEIEQFLAPDRMTDGRRL
ncbi:hypothetical protein ACFT5C_21285 [Streptomyces sp. NPDC057116]|uniref:hypothetical protein n=1 Tax=Streptomyces sp. NPDC057116 TaxID=3346023 RepID=UPI003636AD90